MTPLSVRQEQVLSLVAQGRTDKEIAMTLEISVGTVNCHMTAILQRLEAKSRAHAVAIRFCRTGAKIKPGRLNPAGL